MIQGHINLARALTCAGILPPWLALILHVSTGWPWAGFAALTYGAVIASFVCGMHWGLAMQPHKPMPVNLLITSNVGALSSDVVHREAYAPCPFADLGTLLQSIIDACDAVCSNGK